MLGAMLKEPSMRRRLLDYSVYVVVRILICLVQALRITTGQRLARRLAWLFCDVLRVRARRGRR